MKKLKKKLKKKSFLQVVLAWIVGFFSGQMTERSRSDRYERSDRSRSDHYERPDRSRSDRYERPDRERHRPKSTYREKPASRTRIPAPTSPQKRSSVPDPLVASLQQAQQYQTNIEAMAQAATPDSVERMRLDALSGRVYEWTLMIEEIVEQVFSQQEDALLAAERKQVPAAIARLEKQLARADNPALREKLERTLENRRKQLAQLQQTSTDRQIAELKVENALAQLGIIYSQLHSGRSIAEHGGYERLSAEINDEIHTLEDYLEAYQALHSGE